MRNKQSSLCFFAPVPPCCQQLEPKTVASRGAAFKLLCFGRGFKGRGGFQRWSPVGGCAYGTPRNERVLRVALTTPRRGPLSGVVTIEGSSTTFMFLVVTTEVGGEQTLEEADLTLRRHVQPSCIPVIVAFAGTGEACGSHIMVTSTATILQDK